MWHDMGWGGMWFGWVFWIIVIGLVVYAIVRATTGRQQTSQSSNETPLDILKKRYAKGEINKEQFEEMKKNLE
ncbi:SHOCT domain-containing protein [candidate division KSB1 bacterium]|nr:SHOCT domain-containing protein [candidate division KSB1 bacterium]